LLLAVSSLAHVNEVRYLEGHTKFNDFSLPLPHEYIDVNALPKEWNWGNVNGVNYLTKSLNQHIPVYCGSCWAHGATSALADRIKIARKAAFPDINLAIQFILNCGTQVAGSCNGGSHTGTYEFIKQKGLIPYDTCLQYEACSHDSGEERCGKFDYSCTDMNTCRTCSTFTSMGGKCVGLVKYPNASIAEYGQVSGADKMAAEIYARGPIACGVNAGPIDQYTGGIFDDKSAGTMENHIVSVVGWGHDDTKNKDYWIVRNSWGEYWGERGFFRIVKGENQLGLEDDCAWATPKSWTEMNYPCYEDGSNCEGRYTDSSIDLPAHIGGF